MGPAASLSRWFTFLWATEWERHSSRGGARAKDGPVSFRLMSLFSLGLFLELMLLLSPLCFSAIPRPAIGSACFVWLRGLE